MVLSCPLHALDHLSGVLTTCMHSLVQHESADIQKESTVTAFQLTLSLLKFELCFVFVGSIVWSFLRLLFVGLYLAVQY